ncbi:MAG: aminotransferase class IV [Balneolales bacterium]
MVVYLNGEFVKKADAKVSVDDRGFVFGDGIYEVIRVVDGHLFLPDPHMKRLAIGLDGLAIRITGSMLDSIIPIAEELIEKNELTSGHATIYLQITRGHAVRTHEFPPIDTKVTIYMSAAAFTPNLGIQEQGVAAITMADIRWTRCDLKTVNLLPNVLAKQRALDAGVFTAIFIRDGAVTEGQNSNIFGVKNGVLRTYPLTNYILPGITRALVLEMADKEDIPIDQSPILESELMEMDELFLSGTTTDIQPIVTINRSSLGTGLRGEVTERFQELLRRKMAKA